ncbi:Sua5/YciO/YrdC/YwlC family protein [Streptomyces sp. SCSIO 30461]|uniref:L-threonylcarbamoyladenylate synthase n=1 Tax=Streptomyces sp. SCSIO 30461 TaxID=3118085 RepID=UPI0030D00EAA
MRVIGSEDLEAAAQAIERGGLVIVPTGRWYMVCADASNAQACDDIITGKRRPSGKPLAYVAPSIAACKDLFVLSPEAKRLASAFWPGDLALLLPWKNPEDATQHSTVGSPALVTIAPGTLGNLALAVKVPLAATTANISGDASPSDPGPAITIDQVHAFLADSGLEADFIVDGGVCPAANHMTIVDCFTPETSLVRTGLVHQRALSAVLGTEIRTA